jgi:hypothetical protein
MQIGKVNSPGQDGNPAAAECSGRRKPMPGTIGRTLDCMEPLDFGGPYESEPADNQQFSLDRGTLVERSGKHR